MQASSEGDEHTYRHTHATKTGRSEEDRALWARGVEPRILKPGFRRLVPTLIAEVFSEIGNRQSEFQIGEWITIRTI